MVSHILSSFNEEPYQSKIFQQYFSGCRIGIVDIETTGLNPFSSSFILGGLISWPDGSAEQFFVEDPTQEKEILKKYMKRLADFDVIITYNGNAFDIPFLKKRSLAHHLQEDYRVPYNLDLYLILHGYSNLRRFLPDLKQKTIENFLGLWTHRKDEISGRESVELYNSFLRSGSSVSRDQILLHNRDDICQLSRLLPIIEKVNFQKAMHHLGFPLLDVPLQGSVLHIKNISLDSKELMVSGDQRKNPCEYHSFGTSAVDYKVSFDRNLMEFQLNIPLQKMRDFFLLDVSKYLPSADPLSQYPSLQEDFLILRSGQEIHYQEIHHFIQLFLKNMGGQIT